MLDRNPPVHETYKHTQLNKTPSATLTIQR